MNIEAKPCPDYDEIVRDARMQRSVAIAEAIASVVAVISAGVSRLFGGAAARAHRSPEVQVHRS